MALLPPPPTNKPFGKAHTRNAPEKKWTKSVLIISSQYFPFAEWIDDKDIKKVFLTTSVVASSLSPGDKKAYQVLLGFPVFDRNSNVEYAAWNLHKEHHFTHVVCLSEEDMLRCAMLREKFGLGGQSLKSTLLFRDKVLMKTVVQEAGLKVPPFSPVDNPLDLLDFISKHG
eukprot:TRINITY_DN5053_c0_g1_i7.p1 TRINITY_DN5053_c0_g1~~TRINITY_DN5053_c0_g1_i7.p1  ORF type:complete len:171 (+),score=25.59 TRINITY_DN5053_c0_g1_i7:65-577(+)